MSEIDGADVSVGPDPTGPDATRWLSPVEQRLWRSYLRASRQLEEALDGDLQEHGLQLSEYEILSMLSESGSNHLRMSEIADLVVQSRSRLTHTASRLESRGWVRRQPCVSDRRGVELVLTDEGRRAIEELSPVHVASVRANLVDLLSPAQFAALGEAMAVVSAGLSRRPDYVPRVPDDVAAAVAHDGTP